MDLEFMACVYHNHSCFRRTYVHVHCRSIYATSFRCHVVIVIAAFIMRTFPSCADVQGVTYYYYPSRWIQFQDRTYSAQFPLPREHSLPSCLSVIWQSPGLPGWRKVNLITVTRRPHHPNIAAGLYCLAT